MIHIEQLTERIIFLKGEVEMKAGEDVKKIRDVKAMLEIAVNMEGFNARDYNLRANECSANADSVSKQLFEALVEEEERHGDQYDVEMENLKKFGVSYLASQLIERRKIQRYTNFLHNH